MEYVFKTENEIVQRAQDILAGRAYVPADAKKLVDDKDQKLAALRAYIALDMWGRDTERSHAYLFEPSGKLLKRVMIGKGDEGSTPANPREVCREALLANASYVAMAHNHPNGDRTPSEADSQVALTTAKALGTVGIQLIADYVVAGPTADDVVIVPPPKQATAKSALAQLLGFDPADLR